MIINDNYYIAINILNRIEKVRTEKSLLQIELCRRMGKCAAWWNVALNGARTLRFNTLCRIAKALNISVEYLITGKNKARYRHCYLNREKIISLYEYNVPPRILTILSQIRNNKKNDLSIKTLLDISYYYKIDIINLIGSDKMYFDEYIKLHKKIFPLATAESQLKKFCEEYNEFGEAEENTNFTEEWGDSLFVAISLQRFKETENLAELLIDNLYFKYGSQTQVKIHKYLDKAVKKVQSREYKFINGKYVREK